MSRSGNPSPVRSMNLRFGFPQSRTGIDRNRLKRCQSCSSVRSKKPGEGPSNATTARSPAPDRFSRCTRSLCKEAGEGCRATRCIGPKRGTETSVPATTCRLAGLRFDL
ncbi:hypothetical protein D3C86_1560370 [compost metagenome]